MIRRALGIVAALAGTAAADHDHGTHVPSPRGAPRSLAASLAVVAATYDAMLFDGDYQGVAGAARFSAGRFDVAAALAGYRLTKNGKTVHGIGDASVHGQVTLLEAGGLAGGVVLGLGLPTGSSQAGLGMGHAMVMPAAWLAWAPGRVVSSISVGYGHGLGDESVHVEHGGVWPLVDPMNYQEVSFGAIAGYTIARPLRAGLRVAGALPIGDGDSRVIGAARAVWTEGRVETALEVGAGLVGAPHTVRGTVEATIRFE